MSAFPAGSIVGTLGLDINPFTQGMLGATAIARLFPSVVQSFLANPLLGLVDIAKQAGDAIAGVARRADNMGEMAEAAGVTSLFLSSVGSAAEDAGSSVNGLADTMKFLNRNTAEALGGNQQLIADFSKLGVTMADLRSLAPEDLFYKMADGIAALPGPAQKTALSMALLGRGGNDMIPLLNKGSEGIRAMAAETIALGAAIDGPMAKAGDGFASLMHTMHDAWRGVVQAFATPIIQYVADHLVDLKAIAKQLGAELRQFAAEHGQQLIGMFKGLITVVQFAINHFEGIVTILGAAVLGKVASSAIGLIGGLANAFQGLTAQIMGAANAGTKFNSTKFAGVGIGVTSAVGAHEGGGGFWANLLALGGGAGGWAVGAALAPETGGLSLIPPLVLSGVLAYAGGKVGGIIDKANAPQIIYSPTINQGGLDDRQVADVAARQVRQITESELARQRREQQGYYLGQRVRQGL